MDRRQFLAAVAASSAAAASPFAMAQDWPANPVRWVVPYPPGGGTDVLARTVAESMRKTLNQTIVVDNRPGASTNIGGQLVASAKPDGYTIMSADNAILAFNEHLFSKLPFSPDKDFTYVGGISRFPMALVVNPAFEAKDFKEFLAYAKANPGKLNYATSGNGTIVHLNTAAFAAQAGIQLAHVPYKGTAQSITDLAAGQVHLLFDSIPTGMPHVASGRLRALAVTGDRRSTLAPNLPTVAESGLPGYSSVTWFGLYGPAGMKPELVGRINQAFNRAIQNPEVIASLAKQGVEPAKPQTPGQFAAMVQADSARWAKVIRDNHITLE